jgi:hypothetical protein
MHRCHDSAATKADWQFITADGWIELKRLYPLVDG